MTITELIKENNLQATDAVVLRKRFLGMVDHYVLYMGTRSSQPVFIANYKDGVKEVSNEEIQNYLKVLKPVRIEKFPGRPQERRHAFNRAISKIGQRAYNYFSNNCEHFKNWVHYGENRSNQVENAGNAGLGTGGAIVLGGIISKNSKAALWGTGIFLIGALLKVVSKK
jgi:hypothetical protein